MNGHKKRFLVLFVSVSVILVMVYYVTVVIERDGRFSIDLRKPLHQQEISTSDSTQDEDFDYAEILKNFLFDRQKCPEGRFLSVIPGGNLGNLVWEYMSLYVIAKLYGKKYNLVPYVNPVIKKSVESAFEALTIPTTNEIAPHCLNLSYAHVVQLNQSFTFELREETPIILGRYSARYDEVLRFGIDSIKKEMRFRRDYVENAISKIKATKEFFKTDDDVIFVGVHYRGTDYVRHLEKMYNKQVDPYSLYKYYVKAMTYFKMKYHNNVIFLFFSIDYEWTKTYSGLLRSQFNMTVNPNRDDRVSDLVLMAQCNHSIINYGTFGATAAYFAQGTTFVYDLDLPLDHRGATVAMGIARILPNWYVVS